ncbi:MAG TPA: hypothetical protein VMX14_09940, partial [Anaerolineae bacterium]|nr:hypothetical protein [Anaerolineae bacterium]
MTTVRHPERLIDSPGFTTLVLFLILFAAICFTSVAREANQLYADAIDNVVFPIQTRLELALEDRNHYFGVAIGALRGRNISLRDRNTVYYAECTSYIIEEPNTAGSH